MDYSIVVSHDDPDPDDDDEEIFCVYLEYLIEKCKGSCATAVDDFRSFVSILFSGERFFRRFVAIRTRILRRVRKGLTRANARLRRRLVSPKYHFTSIKLNARCRRAAVSSDRSVSRSGSETD